MSDDDSRDLSEKTIGSLLSGHYLGRREGM